MRLASRLVALAAAAALATTGVLYGTYAAGGSDSSCYALMAESFASGRLQPSSPLISRVPWPDAQKTFTPGGFVPSQANPSAFAPVCAPGFSILLAPVVKVAGAGALFYVTPAAGAVLVWLTYVAGATLAVPAAGAMAAVAIATSPAVLYQIVQPMNDIATTALWMAVFVGLISRRFLAAGVSCGVALLVRPNLLPLAVVASSFVLLIDRKKAVSFGIAALPFAVIVLWLNAGLYGGPFRSGYGSLDTLFALAFFPTNASRYSHWLIETQTPFPLLAFAAPFAVDRSRRPIAWLALALIVTTLLIYFFYTPFDDWSYLRFLLPALALMLVLASAVVGRVVWGAADSPSRSGLRQVAAAAAVCGMTIALGVFGIRTANTRFAFTMHALEQRYRSAGSVVREQLPPDSVVLSVWDSGAVRFHGRREALVWEGLDPAWLDRGVEWLGSHGYRPYILVESWEEAGFRSRFGNQNVLGKLDWPPKYEVDRVVRIYDPEDRAKYNRGEHVITQYLWPFRRNPTGSPAAP